MIAANKGEALFWRSEIVFWGDRLAAHSAQLSYERFAKDSLAVDAFCWCISCIGETAARLLNTDSGLLKNAGLTAALRSATSARNRYVHGYFDLETRIVWDAAMIAVPSLVAALKRHYLASGSDDGRP
mgnify:CR=1 FL=1